MLYQNVHTLTGGSMTYCPNTTTHKITLKFYIQLHKVWRYWTRLRCSLGSL